MLWHRIVAILVVAVLLIPGLVQSADPAAVGIGKSLLSSEQDAFPKGSIGSIVTRLDELLARPESERKNNIPSWPFVPKLFVRSTGVFTSLEVNSDGATFRLQRLLLAGTLNQQVAWEIPRIDPRDFDAVNAWYADYEGEGDRYQVSVDYRAGAYFNAYNSKRELVEGDWLGALYFKTEDDGREAFDLMEELKLRANLEKTIELDLPAAESFADRRDIYDKIHDSLRKGNVRIGFFGAAGSVTDAFNYNPLAIYQSIETREFMSGLSKDLAAMNAEAALELLRFGRLTRNGQAILLPGEIDSALVQMEQQYAETKLTDLRAKSLQSFERVVMETDAAMSIALGTVEALPSPQGPVLPLTALRGALLAQQRKREMTRNPEARLSYASLEDRILIGTAAAELSSQAD